MSRDRGPRFGSVAYHEKGRAAVVQIMVRDLEIGQEGVRLDCGCYAKVLGPHEDPDRTVFEVFGNISECQHFHHNGDTKSLRKDEHVFVWLGAAEDDE